MKLTDHAYACNNLKNFESEAHTKIGNGSYEKLVKSLWVNLISASLSQFESLCEDVIEKLMKLPDHTYACKNLTNFESEVHAKIGNGSYEKTGEITLGEPIFSES